MNCKNCGEKVEFRQKFCSEACAEEYYKREYGDRLEGLKNTEIFQMPGDNY